MNWEALGTLAEIVGAIAVVITLVYLSIQTRLTRIATEETSKHASQQATNAVMEMYSRWRGSLLDTADVSAVLIKARGSEALTAQESLIFSTYFEELFYVAVTAYRSGLYSASGHKESNDALNVAAVISANPKAHEEWIRMMPFLANISEEFVADVQTLIEKQSSRRSSKENEGTGESVDQR